MIAEKMSCLDKATIGDLLAGKLPETRFAEAMAHVDTCKICASYAVEQSDIVPLRVLTLPAGVAPSPFESESACGAMMAELLRSENLPKASDAPPMQWLGPYKLLRLIGQGGMGRVYLAEHTRLQRKVAIKLLPRDKAGQADWMERFNREMTCVAALEHPNVVRALDAGDQDDWHYLVMEYLDGLDVSRVARRSEAIPISAACEVVRQAALGLEAIHQSGLVHRDLKPSNIFLTTDGDVKLLDLGLVISGQSPLEADDRLTTVGHLMGTLPYMSREQISDPRGVNCRSDIYSLGTILYELLTSRVPFKGTATEILDQIAHREPKPPRSLNHGIPHDLETICLKALSKDPATRYQSAEILIEDLQRFLNGEPILARAVGLHEHTWRWMKRNRALSGLITLTVCVAFLFSGAAWNKYHIYRSARQQVLLDTQPSGANVVLFPLEKRTGEPLVEQKIDAGRSPVSRLLLPGNYLVVAYFDENAFHEVLRHVPSPERTGDTPEAQNHRHWTLDNGLIRLPSVHIPSGLPPLSEMAVIPATEFTMGSTEVSSVLAPHRRYVPEFSIDQREVTYRDFVEINNREWPYDCGLPCEPEDSLRCVDWHRAVAFAESAGKRLPSEAEFERVASLAHQVDEHGNDSVTIENQVVNGLTSSVFEWTATWSQTYPGAQVSGANASARIVRGGYGATGDKSITDKSRSRVGLPVTTWEENLGFRCVRSRKPRLDATDFERVIE